MSGTELIWSHWTQLEEVIDASANTPGGSKAATEPVTTEARYVLRPWYQRVGLITGQVTMGAGLIVLLFTARMRIVRRLYVIPSSRLIPNSPTAKLVKSPNDRFLLVQSVLHLRDEGKIHPLSECQLQLGDQDDELDILINGSGIKYWLKMEDASILGDKKAVWPAKEALYKVWYGRAGKRLMAKDGWTKQDAV